MTNLGGHDVGRFSAKTFEAVDHDRPIAFIAYTIKGYGLPLAGHKDNHAGLMTRGADEELQAPDMAFATARNGRRGGLDRVASRQVEDFLDAVSVQCQGPRRASARERGGAGRPALPPIKGPCRPSRASA